MPTPRSNSGIPLSSQKCKVEEALFHMLVKSAKNLTHLWLFLYQNAGKTYFTSMWNCCDSNFCWHASTSLWKRLGNIFESGRISQPCAKLCHVCLYKSSEINRRRTCILHISLIMAGFAANRLAEEANFPVIPNHLEFKLDQVKQAAIAGDLVINTKHIIDTHGLVADATKSFIRPDCLAPEKIKQIVRRGIADAVDSYMYCFMPAIDPVTLHHRQERRLVIQCRTSHAIGKGLTRNTGALDENGQPITTRPLLYKFYVSFHSYICTTL